MSEFTLRRVDLHLFDGAAGGVEAGAADGEAAAPAGENAGQEPQSALPKAETGKRSGGSRRSKAGEFDNVVFGKQEDASAAEATAAADSDAGSQGEGNAQAGGTPAAGDSREAKRAAFRTLIEGEYKEAFTEAFQQAFNRRFKESKGMEQSLADQKPIMELLAQRYNVADGDAKKLLAAIEEDTVYWNHAAEKAGVSVEQLKTMQKLERDSAELQRLRRLQQTQQAAQQRLNAWYAEGEKVKELYPTFDFRTEAADRDFLGLLKSGLSVQQAYELMHMEEIKANAARVAAQTTGQQMAARLQTKAARPRENGTSAQSAVIVKNDVHSLSRAERAEIAKRAARGESIQF